MTSPSEQAAGDLQSLIDALDERELFSNPRLLDQAADAIDCCPECTSTWHESDTNAGGCRDSERGGYCPNDVATTLRALAKYARAAGELGLESRKAVESRKDPRTVYDVDLNAMKQWLKNKTN